MTKGDSEGGIFLSYPYTNNGLSLLLTTIYIYIFIYLFIKNKLTEVPCAKLQFHRMTLLDVVGKTAWVRKKIYPMVKSQISVSNVQEIDI